MPLLERMVRVDYPLWCSPNAPLEHAAAGGSDKKERLAKDAVSGAWPMGTCKPGLHVVFALSLGIWPIKGLGSLWYQYAWLRDTCIFARDGVPRGGARLSTARCAAPWAGWSPYTSPGRAWLARGIK